MGSAEVGIANLEPCFEKSNLRTRPREFHQQFKETLMATCGPKQRRSKMPLDGYSEEKMQVINLGQKPGDKGYGQGISKLGP